MVQAGPPSEMQILTKIHQPDRQRSILDDDYQLVIRCHQPPLRPLMRPSIPMLQPT